MDAHLVGLFYSFIDSYINFSNDRNIKKWLMQKQMNRLLDLCFYIQRHSSIKSYFAESILIQLLAQIYLQLFRLNVYSQHLHLVFFILLILVSPPNDLTRSILSPCLSDFCVDHLNSRVFPMKLPFSLQSSGSNITINSQATTPVTTMNRTTNAASSRSVVTTVILIIVVKVITVVIILTDQYQ